MRGLVECVPNFSEGRRPEVVDELASAVASTPEVHLLDRTSDPDHNRSVLTFAGPVDAVTAAMDAAVEVALARIDMGTHAGQHPRIGAVDVIPFVPLGETALDSCVALARDYGRALAERFDLPVYLYAAAATRPDRVALADVRRPQFEGLRSAIAEDPERAPDFGPARLHPSGGAVAVGARPFLIAYNINLESRDVELAKRIASAVREKDGGLPRVQALGLWLEELGCAQVSMNLLDHQVTPLWRVWEEVGRLADAAGVELRESELIGLAPLASLLSVADHAGVPDDDDPARRIARAAEWLRVRAFDPSMALELRLAAATAAASATEDPGAR
jgi:glutamate formiminotransferase / 5-formyltetrahydrofolate cyclo-ligase